MAGVPPAGGHPAGLTTSLGLPALSETAVPERFKHQNREPRGARGLLLCPPRSCRLGALCALFKWAQGTPTPSPSAPARPPPSAGAGGQQLPLLLLDNFSIGRMQNPSSFIALDNTPPLSKIQVVARGTIIQLHKPTEQPAGACACSQQAPAGAPPPACRLPPCPPCPSAPPRPPPLRVRTTARHLV